MSIIRHVTLQKIVAHDFRYDLRIRSAQHVSGNLLPIIRSMRLRFLQHMVTCCCGGQGVGERQRGTSATLPLTDQVILMFYA